MRILTFIFIVFNGMVYSQDSASRINRFIQQFVDNHTYSGCVVIAVGDSIQFEECYGNANYELEVANTPESKFRIASITKSFTEVAIEILESRGKIQKSDKLSQYYEGIERGETITIEHLLNHEAGLIRLNSFEDYDQLAKDFYTIEGVIDLFKDKPLKFEPGSDKSYSSSYIFLAYIIEKISGHSYAEFLKANIFEPAGMNSTLIEGSQDIVENKAYGYQPSPNGEGLYRSLHWNVDIKIGGGNITSTASDIYKFLRAYYTGKLTPHPALPDNKSAVYYFQGNSPGYASQARIYFENDVYVVVLSNNYSQAAWKIGRTVGELFNGKDLSFEVPAVLVDSADDARKFARFHNKEEFGWRFWILENSDGTFSIAPNNSGKPSISRRTPAHFIGNNSFYLPYYVAIVSFSSSGEDYEISWKQL